jgi:hypothetical protein
MKGLLSLPTSLLLLLLSSGAPSQSTNEEELPAQWPHNLPPHVKYWPEDPPYRRRDLEAIQDHILRGHVPVAVKKMSGDESEKFYPEYWGYHEQGKQYTMSGENMGSSIAGRSLREEFAEEEAKLFINASAQLSFRPAFKVHSEQEISLIERGLSGGGAGARGGRSAAAALSVLEKRDFQCPAGTSACANIAAPNLCCATGETCFTIADTGLGSVGCCPSGANCAGSITCAPGNTPCASNIGGGCCIPGYNCAGIGCKCIILTKTSCMC